MMLFSYFFSLSGHGHHSLLVIIKIKKSLLHNIYFVVHGERKSFRFGENEARMITFDPSILLSEHR